MAFANFSSAVNQTDVLRSNRFLLTSSDLFGDGLLVKSASLPGSSVGVTQAYHGGRVVPLAGDVTNQPWTVTVYIDGQGTSYQRLWDYYNTKVMNVGDVNTGLTYSAYNTDILVEQRDRKNKSILKFKLTGAWPSSIYPVELEQSESSEASSVEVTIQYTSIESI